jgi:hypothetical protein
VSRNPRRDAHVDPNNVIYEINDSRDIAILFSPGRYTLQSIVMADYILKEDDDYTLSNGFFTLSTAFWETLTAGEHTIVFKMSGGSHPILKIQVIEDDIPPPDTAVPEEPFFYPAAAKTLPFIDVLAGDWFYADIEYMYNHNLMIGISTEPLLFGPQDTMTRGMVVAILHRLAGNPETTALVNLFDDVDEEAYYTDAIKWAIQNGLIHGYGDGCFGPEDEMTREHLGVILLRFAALTGRGTPDNNFDPKGKMTRAEYAAIFRRFLEAEKN